MADYSPITVARFWSKVSVQWSALECWEWTGAKGRHGYGKFKVREAGANNAAAHRVAYELCHGPIPTGLVIRHKCDNPSCCNPNHLEAGTVHDNSRDMIERGRHKPVRLKGADNPSCKISEDDVREIKKRIAAGENNIQIANDYPISHSMVSNIRRGKAWAHI